MAGRRREPLDHVALKLRCLESLRAALEVRAKASGNSLNGEIVERLQRSLREEDWTDRVERAVRKALGDNGVAVPTPEPIGSPPPEYRQ